MKAIQASNVRVVIKSADGTKTVIDENTPGVVFGPLLADATPNDVERVARALLDDVVHGPQRRRGAA